MLHGHYTVPIANHGFINEIIWQQKKRHMQNSEVWKRQNNEPTPINLVMRPRETGGFLRPVLEYILHQSRRANSMISAVFLNLMLVAKKQHAGSLMK